MLWREYYPEQSQRSGPGFNNMQRRPSMLNPNFMGSTLARDSYRQQVVSSQGTNMSSKLGGGQLMNGKMVENSLSLFGG